MFHVEQITPEKLIEELLNDSRLQFLPKECLEGKISKLSTYTRLWDKWNKKISLTAEREMGLYIRNHFFVSFQFVKALDDPKGIVDIGSGGGLPGIPLKVLFPEVPMLLVECRRKRANFLKQVVRDLSLKTAVVLDCKVEDVDEAPFPIDTAVFRAVADTDSCLEMASDILEPCGKVILMRTSDEASTDSTNPAYSRTHVIPIEDFKGNPLFLTTYQKTAE